MSTPDKKTSDGLTNDIVLSLIKAYCGKHIELSQQTSWNKPELLMALYSQTSEAEVFRCGYSVKHIQKNPILDALHQSDHPIEFMRRWGVLESYSHARNRTRVIASKDDDKQASFTIEHYSLYDEPIHWLNHCFVWGMLQGIIEGCQFSGGLYFNDQRADLLLDLSSDGELASVEWSKAENAYCVEMKWTPDEFKASPPSEQVKQDELLAFLASAIASDPMRQWKVNDLADEAAYSVRSLQRLLKDHDETFSKLLTETRLQVAVGLMKNAQMSISEIAFCSGFSDHAHFTRRFKASYGSPPSAYLQTIHK